METFLEKLVELVPDEFRALALLLLVAAYFGIPFLRDRAANKRYWEFRTHQFQLLQAANTLKLPGFPDLLPEVHHELEAQKLLLIPDLRPRIGKAMFLGVGALGALTSLTLISLLPVFTGELALGEALAAAVAQTIAGFLFLLPFSARSKGGAFVKGLIAGVVVHLMVILVVSSSPAA